MTQQTKPTAGALRAARKIAERTLRTLQGWDEQTWVDIAAEIIDRETAQPELSGLLEAAKQVMADLSDEEVPDADTVERLEQAISKAEQGE